MQIEVYSKWKKLVTSKNIRRGEKKISFTIIIKFNINIYKSELSEIGKTWDEIETFAQVRTSWQRFVDSPSHHVGQ